MGRRLSQSQGYRLEIYSWSQFTEEGQLIVLKALRTWKWTCNDKNIRQRPIAAYHEAQ